MLIVDADGQSSLVDLTQETPCPCEDPTWSPKGDELAFVGPRAGDGTRPIMVIAVTGGSAREVAANGLSPSWAP